MDEFHFSIARITAVQLCRAAGIDRCARVAIDTFTDVLIKYLMLLGSTAAAAAEDGGRSEVDVSDVLLAFTECGVTRQRVPGDETADIDEFNAWLKGPSPQRALQAAKPHRQFSALGSVLPASGTNPLLGSLGMELPEPTADWLRTIVNQQTLMGHANKFKNTEFDTTPSDQGPQAIAGGPASIEEFYAEMARK